MRETDDKQSTCIHYGMCCRIDWEKAGIRWNKTN